MVRACLVIYEKDWLSWGAYVPDLPARVAAADTREEVETLIRDAIRFHIEGLRLHGEPIPEATTDAGRVRVAA